MNMSCYFPVLFFLIVVFRSLGRLGVDFELPRGPSHFQKSSFYKGTPTRLIQRGFELKDVLQGVLRRSLGLF